MKMFLTGMKFTTLASVLVQKYALWIMSNHMKAHWSIHAGISSYPYSSLYRSSFLLPYWKYIKSPVLNYVVCKHGSEIQSVLQTKLTYFQTSQLDAIRKKKLLVVVGSLQNGVNFLEASKPKKKKKNYSFTCISIAVSMWTFHRYLRVPKYNFL